MRALTPREQRTVRFGAIGLAAYLVIFVAMQVGGFVSRKRVEYDQLLDQARSLRQKTTLYQSKAQHLQKLMDSFQLDPAKLTRETVLGQASAAIQRAAMSGGVQIGPVRELPARPTNKELGSIQLEAMGPAPALLKFLQQTRSLGFPLVIDTLQLSSEPMRPGPLKLNLTFLLLDFEQWKPDKTHA